MLQVIVKEAAKQAGALQPVNRVGILVLAWVGKSTIVKRLAYTFKDNDLYLPYTFIIIFLKKSTLLTHRYKMKHIFNEKIRFCKFSNI